MKDKPKASPSYIAWDERIMSQLPEAARKEFPAVEIRRQFIVAEDHGVKTVGRSLFGKKPATRYAVSTTLDESLTRVTKLCQCPAHPSHKCTPLTPLLSQRQVLRKRKRNAAAASAYKPLAKGTEPLTCAPTLPSVANNSRVPRLIVKVGRPAWRVVERSSSPSARSQPTWSIHLGEKETVKLMRRKRKRVLKSSGIDLAIPVGEGKGKGVYL